MDSVLALLRLGAKGFTVSILPFNIQIIFLTVHNVFLFPLYFPEVLLPLCDSVPAPCTVHSLHSQLLPRYSLVLWAVLSVPADDNLKSSLLYLVILLCS